MRRATLLTLALLALPVLIVPAAAILAFAAFLHLTSQEH
jgi:hypothetical protein